MAVLELNNITKRFDKEDVIKNISLSFREGELVTLLGPSGCGKTTLLRMIAGFITPTEGEIRLDNEIISCPNKVKSPEDRDMSMIFQSYALWPNMTVEQNVAFGLRVRKIKKKYIDETVDKLLSTVRMLDYKYRYTSELSGGQQQRVALARALAIKPKILLLDEPLSNLDANLRIDMALEIQQLQREYKCTAIYVTHDQSEAMSISDRIVLLDKGKIEQVDAPFNMYNIPKTTSVVKFIGSTNLLNGWTRDGIIFFEGSNKGIPINMVYNDRSEGGDVKKISIRKHSIYLKEKHDEWIDLGDFEIIDKRYLGEVWAYGIKYPDLDRRLEVHSKPSVRYDVGDVVSVAVNPKGVSIF